MALTQDTTVSSLIDSTKDMDDSNGTAWRLMADAKALMLTMMPIDELQLRVLRHGGIGMCLRGVQSEMPGVGLSMLNSLLTTDAALAAFQSSSIEWVEISDTLSTLLSPRMIMGELSRLSSWQRANELHQCLDLAATLSAHPRFNGEPTSEQRGLWLGLLREGCYADALKLSASLPWAALAAACAAHTSLCTQMLSQPTITARLAKFAAATPAPADEGTLALGKPEFAMRREYARVALHRLTQAAAKAGGPFKAKEWKAGIGRIGQSVNGNVAATDGLVLYDSSGALPVRPPKNSSPQYEFSPYGHADTHASPACTPLFIEDARPLLLCAAAGLVWGALRGSLTRAQRTARPVRVAALGTALAAMGFEAFNEVLKAAWGQFAPDGRYASVVGYTGASCIDVWLRLGALQLLIGPANAPFAFGGWVLGNAAYASTTLMGLSEVDTPESR